MAHYVLQRNNGYGDFDYIRSFETMEITDYPELAVQVDDRYLAYIDMPYLNHMGFYAVGITTLGLRISPLQYFRPMVRNYRPTLMPRPPRAHIPGIPPIGRAPRVPRPPRAPRPAPVPRAARPAPAPRPASRPTARPVGPGGRGGRGPGGRGGRGPGM